MSGAFLVAGVICCCLGHPWWGSLLIVVSARVCVVTSQNRPDRTYYRQ